ncbi:MAG: glycosyltransferase family 39 protein [Phycisphaerae bacterium]|nr:glycosyltransferase family 39 protein [Phycisphaerae bacterium]
MARLGLVIVLFLALVIVLSGISWGLPSRRADKYLFGSQRPWPGERLVELKGSDWSERRGLGADVDVDPLAKRHRLVDLTETDRGRAEILIRYRLYSNQPDEVITLRALAGMRPSKLQLDPKLYQYGGMFVYPVGAIIGLGSALGLIEVSGNLARCLDHPSAFGAMYVAMRLYSSAFALLGVVTCYLIGRRLGHRTIGLLAGSLFILMPVVITMSHEGKPHLVAAVMMLLAGLVGMAYVRDGRRSQWLLLAALTGLAGATVLSAWPAASIMLVAIARRPCETKRRTLARLAWGVVLAGAVFLVTNPYLLINLLADRAFLRSNLGNSMAMYEVGRIAEGAWTVARLLVEGMSLPLVIVGTVSLLVLLSRRTWCLLPLLVPAGLALVQFTCIGAGKPGEYGRFLIFPASVLAIAAAWGIVMLFERHRRVAVSLAVVLLLSTGFEGGRYLLGFLRDASSTNSRASAAQWLADRTADNSQATIGLVREPAPYCVPPLDFDRRRVVLLPRDWAENAPVWPDFVVVAVDRPDELETAWWTVHYAKTAVFPRSLSRWWSRPTVISWADKPIAIYERLGKGATSTMTP